MFIRKKKINGTEYAYLVENKYNKKKKSTRQKSKQYLGKVIKLDSNESHTQASSIKEALINELINKGFKKSKNKLIKGTLLVDMDSNQVIENNKKICLELNEGFLCDLTLTNLFKFNTKNLSEKEIMHNLADVILSAGINLDSESFIKIYKSNNSIQKG